MKSSIWGIIALGFFGSLLLLNLLLKFFPSGTNKTLIIFIFIFIFLFFIKLKRKAPSQNL